MEAGIAGITEAWRSTRNDLASNTFVKTIEAEGVHIPIRELHGQKWRPTKPIVECHLPRDFPCVLQIKSKVVLRQVFGIGIRLVERSYPPRQKVGHGRAGSHNRRPKSGNRSHIRYGPGKNHDAWSPGVRTRIQEAAAHAAAKSKLVGSTHHRQIVVHTEVRHGRGGDREVRRQTERKTGASHRSELRDVAEQIPDSHVSRTEVLCRNFVRAHAIS